MRSPRHLAERAVLDTSVSSAYERAGITSDPATWTTPAPLLQDLHTTLRALATRPLQADSADGAHGSDIADDDDGARRAGPEEVGSAATTGTGAALAEVAASLAALLPPFVGDGAFADLFASPTTTPPQGHLFVWSLRRGGR